MGLRAKESIRARNAVLVLGCLVLIAGDLCYAYMPSTLGECGWALGRKALRVVERREAAPLALQIQLCFLRNALALPCVGMHWP